MKRWRLIEDRDVQKVIALWDRCKLTRPWNDPVTDIGFARRGPSSAVLVWDDKGEIIATVMVGHDGHRGVMYYLAVDPSRQREGLGREVIAAAEKWLSDLGVWKINLLVRNDNEGARGFYEKLGFSENAVVSYGKLIKR
jgi:ribosomal protein S18 acetylase RimI-like enzyme